MSDISNPIIENALQGNLIELSQRNEQTHLQIRTLNEMVGRLRKENAKLRAERDYLLMNSNPTATELRRVRRAWKNDRDENAKLRELVRDMCDLLPHADWPSAECDDRASACIDQAIELGIKVTDD